MAKQCLFCLNKVRLFLSGKTMFYCRFMFPELILYSVVASLVAIRSSHITGVETCRVVNLASKQYGIGCSFWVS